MKSGVVKTIITSGALLSASLLSTIANAGALSFFDNSVTNPALNPDVATVAPGDMFTAQVFGNDFPLDPLGTSELSLLAFSVSWDASALSLDSFDASPWFEFSSGDNSVDGLSTITFTANLGAGLSPFDTFGSEFTAITLDFSVNPGVLTGDYALDISQDPSQVAQTLDLDFIPIATTLVDGNVSINASAVPLPAAVWLFASAIAGLGVFRRRADV